jgi:2-oxoglutarate ferredoxin oxidoreductase subunit alpha
MSKGAVSMGRSQGMKMGLFRPITIRPFPTEALREAATKVQKILVVEDSPGEFVDDVEAAVQGKAPVHLLGIEGRHIGGASGLIFPETILEKARSLP